MPTAQAPPSSTSTSANSSATCAAVVGLTRPKRLALGAASPCTPRAAQAASRLCATGCAGQRRPMLACPPAASSATPSRRARMSVSGPGQKAAISRCARSGTCRAKCPAASLPATCTMRGWLAGRPLTAKMRRTAPAFSASAARPYTVSVGRPSSSPAATASAACASAPGWVGSRIMMGEQGGNTSILIAARADSTRTWGRFVPEKPGRFS